MARRDISAEIQQVVGLLEGLGPDADEAHQMPGVIEYSEAERAQGFARELREVTHGGRTMAGPYVRSFYNGDYPADAVLPNWLAKVADEPQITHFLEMHGRVRAMLQENLGVHGAFLGGRHKFVNTLAQLMESGVVTRFTNGRDTNTFIRAMENASLHVGNVNDTYADGLEGYFDYAGKSVTIAPGVGHTDHDRVLDTQERIDRVLPRILGGLYGKGTAGWMRTAFGEHLGQVMQDDNFAPTVFSPVKRGEDMHDHPFAVYQRELIDKVLTYGGSDLTKDFMLAMTSADLNSGQWHMFRESFDELWGVDNAFDKVTDYMTRRIEDARREDPDAVEATHHERAAEATLLAIQEDPAHVFGRPDRAKPVGAIAMHIAKDNTAHKGVRRKQ